MWCSYLIHVFAVSRLTLPARDPLLSMAWLLCIWQEKMVSINNDAALAPRPVRDTRRMNMFVSISAAVAGLLFGFGYWRDCRGVAFHHRSLCVDQPPAGVGGQQHDAGRGNWCAV